MDKKQLLRFASLQGKVAEQLGIASENQSPDSLIYRRKGKFMNKSTAVIWILFDIAWYLKWVPILLIIPPFMRNAIYDFIARRRYRWFGQLDACSIPEPGKAHLFLDAKN